MRERLREKKTCQAQRQRSSIRPVSQASGTMRRHALGLGSKGRVRLPELVLGPSSLWKCRSSRSNTSIAFRNPSTGVQLHELLSGMPAKAPLLAENGLAWAQLLGVMCSQGQPPSGLHNHHRPIRTSVQAGIASTGNVKHSSRHE